MGQFHSTQNQRPTERAPQRRSTALRPTSAIFSRPRLESASQPRPRSIQIPNSTPRPWSPHPRGLSPAARRRSRLTRARSAFVESLPNVFHRRGHGRAPDTIWEELAEQRQTEIPTPNLESPSLPHLQVPSLDLNFETPNQTTDGGSRPELRRRGSNNRPMSNIADRIQSLTPARELSRLTASLRRRGTRRRPAEDNSQMLSRLLSLAAAATAASLMGGHNDHAVNDLRNVAEAVDGDDGTFDGFLQALRSGRLANHLGQNENTQDENGDDTPRPPPSLDFFRMFRFGSSHGDRRRNPDSPTLTRHSGGGASETGSSNSPNDDNNAGNRMIPILIVGIRSLNNTAENGGEPSDAMPSFLDALTNLPATTNLGLSNQDRNDGYLQNLRISRGHRFDRRRRASMGGLGLFSGGLGTDRETSRRSGLSGRPRPQSEIITPSTTSSTPLGPYPPPTTPSSPPLSAPSTGASTPNRRSSMSFPATSSSNFNHRDDQLPSRAGRSSMLDPTAEEPSPFSFHRRRNSDSGHGRIRSRDSRRYGVVGAPNFPNERLMGNDRLNEGSENSTQPTESNRSWIIYVLGGSYPENHPILTTPSLFTDSPTYEDMLLLSSLLGPAKPPVANAEDVADAGGLFTIVNVDGRIYAEAVDGDERMPIVPGENCLVCLSPYQINESARRLKICSHFFHRECIDQWLTTGRNSCPLCRSQGVDEKSTSEAESPGEGSSSSTARAPRFVFGPS